MNMTPSLTDLIKIWAEDVLPDQVFKIARFTYTDKEKGWSIFWLGSRTVAYIYDDFIILLDTRSRAFNDQYEVARIRAADPEFFDKLAKHIIRRVKSPPADIMPT